MCGYPHKLNVDCFNDIRLPGYVTIKLHHSIAQLHIYQLNYSHNSNIVNDLFINMFTNLEITIFSHRSGLSWKHHLDVGAGVIDSDYRGNVGIILFNLSHVDYEVKQGDRIAQLIIQKICTPTLKEVEVIMLIYCCRLCILMQTAKTIINKM